MGICCCVPTGYDHQDERNLNVVPDLRRKQMADAAEHRQKSMEYRGIKDPQGFKRRQLKQKQLEELDMQTSENSCLRWQIG